MICTQQLIALMALYRVAVPSSLAGSFKMIMEISSFNLINLNDAIDGMLRLKSKPFNPNFSQVGLESKRFFNMMGTLMFGFVLYFVGLIVLAVLNRIKGTNARMNRIAEFLNRQLLHNFIITMLMRFYTIILLSCFVSVYAFKAKPFGEFIQATACIIFFAAIIIVPVQLLAYIAKNWDNLPTDAKLTQKFGSIFEDLNQEGGFFVLSWPLFDLFRRFMIVGSVTFLSKHLAVQLLISGLCITGSASIISNLRPFNAQIKTIL